MSISMPGLLSLFTLSLLLTVLSFGCAGKKPETDAVKPETAPAPPIYVDISDFERPPCSTPDVGTKSGLLCGNIIGTSGGKAVNAYLGIPFAESTAGRNRWRAPAPRAPWEGVLRATRTGPACPQTGETIYPESEDCLYLNVWVPAEASPAPRAVMVFIYGGAFVYGYDAQPLYDGAYTAGNGDVIVVNVNYRVGALGFLSGVKDAKTGEAVNGNFGILDQIAALEWVRDNVASFGGDPEKVTIYGESAGAMSVGIHLVSSPRSKGLFRAAIMESNPLGLPYKNVRQSRAVAREFASNLGCGPDDLACMRAQPAEAVLAAQMQMDMALPALFHGIRDFLAWSPVVDGDVVVQQPIRAIEDGRLTKPVILGTNRNEGLLFVEVVKSALGWKKVSDFDYHVAIDFFSGIRLSGRKFTRTIRPTAATTPKLYRDCSRTIYSPARICTRPEKAPVQRGRTYSTTCPHTIRGRNIRPAGRTSAIRQSWLSFFTPPGTWDGNSRPKRSGSLGSWFLTGPVSPKTSTPAARGPNMSPARGAFLS